MSYGSYDVEQQIEETEEFDVWQLRQELKVYEVECEQVENVKRLTCHHCGEEDHHNHDFICHHCGMPWKSLFTYQNEV